MARRIVRKVRADGTVQLPRAVREALEISDGDVVELSVGERGEVLVQRVPATDSATAGLR